MNDSVTQFENIWCKRLYWILNENVVDSDEFKQSGKKFIDVLLPELESQLLSQFIFHGVPDILVHNKCVPCLRHAHYGG